MNDETLEEKLTFRLSKMNVIVALGTLSIFLVFITTYIIAFTPLREYIPGYNDVKTKQNVYALALKADSLEENLMYRDLYLENLRKIINGQVDVSIDSSVLKSSVKANYNQISLKKSKQDSLLRLEVENLDKYNLYPGENEESLIPGSNISRLFFFTPLKGIITNGFNPAEKHFGIDIAGKPNEAIKSTLDGTVIFSGWTFETGYVIAVQHQENLISVYKHNSALLKKEGTWVRAGEPIAIIGNTGELTTGPHLHFELWFNGSPVNPKEFIVF